MTPFRQREYDADRITYKLTFPGGLSDERVQAWLTSITGTMKQDHNRILGVQSIVFETVATDQGIQHYLRAPKRDAGYIVGHLETLVPGIHAETVPDMPAFKYQYGVELCMTTPSRTLITPKSNDFSASILSSMQGLRDNEAIVTQWIVTPAPYQPRPTHTAPPHSDNWSAWRSMTARDQANADEIEDRRRKLDQPNVQAAGRIAVAAPHPIRAQQIARNVIQAFASAGSAANRIYGQPLKQAKLQETVDGALTPFFFPAQLTMAELTPIVSWPLGSPYIAGLPQSRTRHIHVTNAVPKVGTVIGESTDPNTVRDIAIDETSRMQHVHIMGPIGSGKTWLSVGMAVDDMEKGRGIVLIDPKGDLYHRVLERVPAHRVKDVINWDLADMEHPIGFNVLQQGISRAAIDELNHLISNLFPEALSVPQLLHHGLHALADTGTFVDLPTFLRPEANEGAWQRRIIRNIKDAQIKKFWEQYLDQPKERANRQDIELAALHRRIWPFVSRAEIRNTLGQAESSFTMPELVSEGKILLVNLNSVRIGRQAAGIMGTLIMNALWGAIRTTPHERPVMLYMDEFQNFVTLPTDPSEMLAQSRSFGLGMVLAHQNLSQISNQELRSAVLANCRSKVIFQTTANDARTMAAELGSQINADDLQNLQFREAIARVMTESGVSQAFTMKTKNATPETGNASWAIEQSRARYGRPVSEVEKAMEARRSDTKADESERPTMGRRSLIDSN
jgi:hypothetical protein